MKKNSIYNSIWTLPIKTELGDIEIQLKKLGSLKPSQATIRQFKLYDSFPNDLWFSKWNLSKEGNTWRLSDPEGDRIEGKAKTEEPRFWWDFCDGELKTPLQSHLGIRGLNYKMSLKRESRLINLKNQDQKTIVRLNLEKHYALLNKEWKLLQKIVELQPLRGHEKEARVFIKKIDPLNWSKGSKSMVKLAYRALGTSPKPYKSKPKFNLKPHTASHEVVSSIVCKLIELVRLNENGIINDIDTEFLHDFRVSTRRIRSLISQTKGVFSENKTLELKSKFSALGQQTSLVRDLDVYLLSKNDYIEMLPESICAGADLIFKDFEKQREIAFKKLKSYLVSHAYKNELKALELYFQNDIKNIDLGKNAKEPIRELASKRILIHYQSVRKWAANIHEDTPDEEIHELRILCKKLRYPIEFFESLYNKKKLKHLVTKLKALQDSLGLFNDYAVQQESLLIYSQQHKRSSSQVHLAIGGIIAVLNQKQNEVRYQVFEQIKKFKTASVRKDFEILFSFDKKGLPS